MRIDRSLFAFFVFAGLSTFALSQSARASAQSRDIIYGESSIEWRGSVPGGGLILTVSGPQGLYMREECRAGDSPRFSLIDDQGRARRDGVYNWELVLQSDEAAGGQVSVVHSGSFEIQSGRVVREAISGRQSVVVDENAPENSLYVDSQGRVGIGTAVPGAQLHLKGIDPGLAIEDTQAGGREYRLHSLKSGDGSLGLFDETTGQAKWLVDGQGRVGINTTEPTATLTVDGYIESTKGFLLNGKPIGGVALWGGGQPLATETGSNNFFGTGAGAVNTGGNNSFFGGSSGNANTSGFSNSFFGAGSGYANTTGFLNTFFGREAGYSNTTAGENAFFGSLSGHSNTTGPANSFFGSTAGFYTSTGGWNAFFGQAAGYYNTTGYSNSFFGRSAGFKNTTGASNSFFGEEAGFANTEGYSNSFFGSDAGYSSTVEDFNTFVGYSADLDPGANPATSPVRNATAIGARAYVSRSNSLVLGGVKGFNGATDETFVGIGTTSPDRQLVVEGSQAIGKFRRYSATGPDFGPAFLFERGRGTNTAPLDILPGDYLGKVQFRGRVGANMPEYGALVFISSDTSQNGRFSFVDRDLVTERMVILNTGNVGIGTSAPTERLDVAGNLRVRGSIVYGAPAVPVPDYVFAPDYKLMPIGELQHYLRTERHLPNVPNAREIQENGVNLGEFQMKLLEKIEELTLYSVQQAQVIDRQKDEAAALRGETAALRQKAASQEERIRALEEMVKTLLEKDQRGR